MTMEAEFPCGCKTLKEANEYGLYESDVKFLQNNPFGTYCGIVPNLCLTDENVQDFLERFAKGPFFLTYALEGEQYNPEENGDIKCVEDLYLKFKEDVTISEEYLEKMSNTPEFKEIYDGYHDGSYDKKIDEKELLSEYFSHLVYLAGGCLQAHGVDPNGWRIFETE